MPDDELNIPDHCWEEKYRGDSRKWLFNYGPKMQPVPEPASCMREGYRHPKIHEPVIGKQQGKRRQLYHEKVMKEVAEEIALEAKIPDPIEEYCTTYDVMFQIPGFKLPDKPEDNTDLFLKYPLYDSSPMTYWRDKAESGTRGIVRLPNMTKAVNPKHPFRKNYNFSKPPSERFDEPADPTF